MSRCVIVGGAKIGDYARARSLLLPDDFIVFCDSGLRHKEGLGVRPSLVVGDFDSFPRPKTAAGIIALPREKDDTDTLFAVREALKRGFCDFLLLGAVGGRLDHTLGNLSILLYLDSLGKRAVLADDLSESEIVSSSPASVDGSYRFFSLLSVSEKAKGVSVTGAKYPLENATLSCEYPIGVSNEVLPGKEARVTVEEGRLLLVKVLKDEN